MFLDNFLLAVRKKIFIKHCNLFIVTVGRKLSPVNCSMCIIFKIIKKIELKNVVTPANFDQSNNPSICFVSLLMLWIDTYSS